MATAKANKKMASAVVELLECPVCMEPMKAPIFLCQSGHSLCCTCTENLRPPICPICRQAMTQMRSWQLEELISKAKVACPNKALGCVYTMATVDTDDHLKECIFREMDCPLGLVFGKCSWSGKLKDMMDHFKERHADHCNVTSDADVEVRNVNINDDDRRFYLVAQGRMLFIITMKIDTLQKMVYWSVQHIGSKKAAQQHIYEIHVASNQDPRRKVTFTEHCFNDTIKVEEVFRQGKCAVLPLCVLGHFIKDKKLSFRFFIKRIPPVNEKTGGKNENKGPNQGPKGPGPKNTGFKGPGPHVPGNKPAKKQNKTQS